MRLKLLLETREPITLPWDYRTDLTKAIYAILEAADPDYSRWLHEHGFRWQNRIYRLFVYSDLMLTHWNCSPQGLTDVRWMAWQISSPDPRFVKAFQAGLERKGGQLELFDTLVEVLDIVRVEVPEPGSGLVFRTISPIAVSIGDPNRSRHPIYLRPDEPRFVEALERNLITKWQAFQQREWDGGEFGLRVWNPKQKLVRVFDTDVRAWHLYLQMWGDEQLIRFAYTAGLGIKNSQGFGMIEPGG
ncbi:CRISPR-associated endoribonuclease Cas6 [Pyrinomonas methylaliphatogenes]|uniref:CRISPR-associated endoribonuclease n=1 Tax=Pyrinomonas methylaliphatogenes TaxID=454194 RepID=A0A0B6X0V7_9BACT|nr:CRISPR-associated endoribonuclease Cas6 [Pyrinomonas methylaliphatogenes]CDM67163.1 CRISPR-associated endoribonuclease Cas6 [Pyrinomonas methylaliphatogenes]